MVYNIRFQRYKRTKISVEFVNTYVYIYIKRYIYEIINIT